MEKKYAQYLDEIIADELYEGLLGYGMFANRLPPVFTSVPFFDYCRGTGGTDTVLKTKLFGLKVGHFNNPCLLIAFTRNIHALFSM